MKREEALLREACAQLAQEEADRLEHSLTDAEKRETEDMFRRHRRKADRIIARSTGSASAGSRAAIALRVAACLIFATGALVLGLRYRAQLPPQTPLSGVLSPTPAPLYTAGPAQTDSPVPSAPPTEAPAPEATVSPTEKPVFVITASPSPTSTPYFDENDQLLPTVTPLPEEADVIPPTATPSPIMSPDRWTGAHYPQQLPDGYTLATVNREEDSSVAAYTLEGRALIFTEYESSLTAAVPRQSRSSYIQLDSGVIALRIEEEEGVTLIWDQDGHTLSLYGEEADVLAIANSVVRLP